jgi:single-strand DNA-binding protein
MNTINLIGNICQDIELKQTTTGKSVVTFNLAVKRPFTKDTTDFIPIVVWDKTAEFLNNYAGKGSKVAVSGKLTTRKYQDKSGSNRTVFEVVADSVEILDGRNDAQGAYDPSVDQEPTSTYTKPVQPKFEELSTDDDLPF